MTRIKILAVLVIGVVIVVLGLATLAPEWPSKAAAQNVIPFAVANMFFELNDTDDDLGIHALIDGEPWNELEIEDPNEHTILSVTNSGRLAQQGLTELFFESAEPPFDELSPEEFFDRFPQGKYEISGITLEGDELESTDSLWHIMPAPAEDLMVNDMAVPEDCDEGPVPLVSEPIIIEWHPVTRSHPDIGTPTDSPSIKIDGYQVVVEREAPTPLKFTFDLPPDVTTVVLPQGLFASGDEPKLEVLVREKSGNQTAVETCFEVE